MVEPCNAKKGFNAFGNAIDPCLPARSVQTGMNLNCLTSLFLNVSKYPIILPHDSASSKIKTDSMAF